MMLETNEPLKPCPFCGEIGAIFEDLRYRNEPTDMYHVYGVECSNPECIMHQQQKFYYCEQAARTAWNRRTERQYILEEWETRSKKDAT